MELSGGDGSSLVELLAGYFSERVLLIGADGTILASLGRQRGMLGFGAEERGGMHVAERVHPDDLPAVLDLLTRARHSAALEEAVVVRARHKDDTWRRLEVTVFSRIRDPSMQAGVLRLRDVTDETVAADVAAEQSRFVSLASALPIGVLSADAEDFLVFTNDAALGLLRVGYERLRGRGWLEQIHPEHCADVETTIARARSSRRATSATFLTADPDDPRWLQILVVPLTEADRYVGWVATLEDVTVRLTAERELAHRATHDALTALPNRGLVIDRLQQALAKCVPRHEGVAVVFIDIDGLKAHNDARGHAAGDTILVDAARRLDGNLRPSDTAGRIGGDEFVVVSDVDSERDAEDLAQQIRELLAYEVAYETISLSVTASVGVAFTNDPTMTPGQVLAAADAAMYRHKTS